MNMTFLKTPNLLLGMAMLAASALAVAITPTKLVADQKPAVILENLVPRQFGDWQEDKRVVYQQVSPELKAALDKIYTQVLTRTYVNSPMAFPHMIRKVAIRRKASGSWPGARILSERVPVKSRSSAWKRQMARDTNR